MGIACYLFQMLTNYGTNYGKETIMIEPLDKRNTTMGERRHQTKRQRQDKPTKNITNCGHMAP